MADPHADLAAPDHVHGQMEISEQVQTWGLFRFLAKWSTLILAAVMVWLVVWFCTDAGLLGGLVAGVAVYVIGFFSLRSKPAAR